MRLTSVEQGESGQYHLTIIEGMDGAKRTFGAWDEFFTHCLRSDRIRKGRFSPLRTLDDSREVVSALQEILDDLAGGATNAMFDEHLSQLRYVWEGEVYQWRPSSGPCIRACVVYFPADPAKPLSACQGKDGLWRLFDQDFGE